MKLAVVAPHPDDEAIACGGTIISWPGEAYCVFIGYEPFSEREEEARKSCAVLGAEPIFAETEAQAKAALENIGPDLVLAPHSGDHHEHHRRCSEFLGKNWKGAMWEYETWAPIPCPDTAVWFSEGVMRRKMKAIKKHASQCKKKDWPGAMKCYNLWRAVVMPSLLYGHGKNSRQRGKYCEAFRVVK